MTGLDESLVKIAKGAGIAFIGCLVGLLFGFMGRLLVARYGTEAEYGVFSLAFAILSICVIVGTLGLQHAAPRSIAYARGKNDIEKVKKLIPSSIQFGLLASVSLSIIVFFASDIIARAIFHNAALGSPLKIFALGIPLLTLINVFAAIFRGFDEVKPGVYFQDAATHLLFPLFLLPVIFLSLPFTGVFYAFLASLLTACAALIVYSAKRLPLPIKFRIRISTNPVATELLFLSLPLLGVAMLHMIIVWTDTLMLGSFKTSADVGLYNAGSPLAQFIFAPMGAMLLIYMPVTSGLYAQGSLAEIRRNFSVLTKWLCSATLPLFLILFMFPETVISFLFGANYTSAATTLRILSVGFIISNLLGPNGASLIAMGEVRFVMWATLASAVINIGLNVALIPPFGIEGAAIASMVAITSVGLIRCWKLYSVSGAQPLSKNLMRPTLASLAIIFLIYFISTSFLTVTLWMLPLLFILYYGIYGLAVLLTRSFDKEDISMLLAIEERLGINLSLLKRTLQRFL